MNGVPVSDRAIAGWRVLAVVAHPDDEYAFASTVYRISHELGGTVDQVVITNGESGFRHSMLAERVYGLALTDEEVGRRSLPDIRKQETREAGRILGIRNHHFWDETDSGFTLDVREAFQAWQHNSVRRRLVGLIREHHYNVIFTLLPSADTHGHHKAATILTLEASLEIDPDCRPVILGAEPVSSADPIRNYDELPGYGITRAAGAPYEFHRSRSLGADNPMSYGIVANWVVAAHKSQGVFQMAAAQHDVERFWRFQVSGTDSANTARHLFSQI